MCGIRCLTAEQFNDLISKIATQGSRWDLLEHFKGYFARAVGRTPVWSSSEDWAETDLRYLMRDAAQNTPMFLEAFFEACDDLRKTGIDVPTVDAINRVCRQHSVAYELQPLNLVQLPGPQVTVTASAPPPTISQSAAEPFQSSSARAEALLAENRPREAVQEMLWMLESLVTVFRDAPLASGQVKGKYFNEIAKELRGLGSGTTLERVIDWCTQLHGYLSSPTGGGVRHGLDVNSGAVISLPEGRLFCNLILSYVTFLLTEHDRLTR